MIRPLLCVVLVAGIAWGAAPSARKIPLTPAQARLLHEQIVERAKGLKARKDGKPDIAIAAMEKALAATLRVFGPWHRHVEEIAGELASLHESNDAPGQVTKYKRLMLEARRGLYGERHWKTVNARLGLDEALAQEKRTPAQREALRRARGLERRARDLLEQAKAARADRSSKKPLMPGDDKDKAALALVAKAIPLGQESLRVMKEIQGHRHWRGDFGLITLSELHRLKGDYRQALSVALEARDVFKEHLGERHPDYLVALHNLAQVHAATKNHAAALPLLKEHLPGIRELYGRDSLFSTLAAQFLADMHMELGDHRSALPLREEVLRLHRDMFGKRHTFYLQGLNKLAFAHADLGDHRAAAALLLEALKIVKELRGRKHPDYATTLGNLAEMHESMGDHKAALPLRTEELGLLKESVGERPAKYFAVLHKLSTLAESTGDFRNALQLRRQWMALAKKHLSERSPKYAALLNDLAKLHQPVGDHEAALSLHLRALAITKEALGDRHPDYARSLILLARALKDAGDYKAALRLNRQALALGAVLGERHPVYADSLNNLAVLHVEMGDQEAALPLLDKLLAMSKETLGERHPLYAATLGNLAVARTETGDHKEALSLSLKALAITKETQGERHADHALCLNNLGLLLQKMGDYKAALPPSMQAVAIRREVLGERHLHYATSLNNLAMLYSAMGDHKAALPLYQKALAITRETLAESHPLHATFLNNLATLYSWMGDYKAALPLVQKALAITREALGERHPAYATSLNNLATQLQKMGDHKAALPLFQKAIALTKETPGERHPLHATCLNNLALLYADMGDHKAGLPVAERALALRKEVFGERDHEYALCLHNLAYFVRQAGDHDAALSLNAKATALFKEALGERHPSYAHGLNSLAYMHEVGNRLGTALLLREQCLAVTRRQLAANASVQSERQQLAAADALRHQLACRLSLPDESAHFSHTHVLSWKGASFAAQQARRLFLQTQTDPETRQIARELIDATRSLALLSSRTDEASRKRAVEYTRIKEEKETRLAQLSEPFRASLKPPSSEAFRTALPPGVVLVDLLAYFGMDPAKPRKGQSPQSLLAAWVLRAEAPTVRIDLGPTQPVEAALAGWREALEKGHDAGAAPARLRALVWAPLEKHLAGAKFVLISPDGALGRLPFAALPGAKAGTFLLEEVPLAVLPVPQVLPRLLLPARGKASLLALGGVEFGDGVGAWAALPATGPEAGEVGARFRTLLKKEATSLSGAKATKAALREALPGHRFAHLATHGFFAPPTMKSALEHERKPDPFGREGVTGWHPGLLSGVVLAGANKPTAEDDGILTALEIAEMDLSNVELAVLSACQTGLGKEAAGEGMLGLQRAFAVAGCKSVVSSLWSVNDAATAVLMERFYHHLWEKKLPKIESLRWAQLDVLHHPEWVEERVKKMRGTTGLRGAGKASEALVGGKAVRRSPAAWWAAWQLSGDWR